MVGTQILKVIDMKKIIALGVTILILLVSIVGCKGNKNSDEGPFSTDNLKGYENRIPVIISSDILQTCYRYAEDKGFAIKDKERYISVLLGVSDIKYVYVGEDDAKRDMLDENDYLIVFQEMRIVIDADTGIVLGTIPFV